MALKKITKEIIASAEAANRVTLPKLVALRTLITQAIIVQTQGGAYLGAMAAQDSDELTVLVGGVETNVLDACAERGLTLQQLTALLDQAASELPAMIEASHANTQAIINAASSG